jgi:hypothetical protein
MAWTNPQKALSGYRGRVNIAADNASASATTDSLLATKWSLTYKTELQDCSTFEEVTGTSAITQGANTPISRYVASLTDMEVSIDCFYDVNNGWIGHIKPGLELNCKLFINKAPLQSAGNAAGINVSDLSNERSVSFRFIIENMTTDVEVRGVIKYTLSGKVSGGSAISFV